MGELVFTTLTKEALPMVRYRTRDLTRLLPGTARSMRRIEKITGRSDDMMILRGVNVFPTQIEEQILKCKGLAPHFYIELTRAGRMDNMVVHVECTEDMTDADARAEIRQGARAPHQERCRCLDENRGARSELGGSLGGQGQACGGQQAEGITVKNRGCFFAHVRLLERVMFSF